jgi:hypothetical protein
LSADAYPEGTKAQILTVGRKPTSGDLLWQIAVNVAARAKLNVQIAAALKWNAEVETRVISVIMRDGYPAPNAEAEVHQVQAILLQAQK